MTRYDKRIWIFAAGLSALAGFVDAIGFIELGGFFVSFMSGNSTRLAVGLAERAAGVAALAGGLVASFVIGVIAGTLVAREAGCTIEMVDGRRAPPGDPSKPPTSGEAFDLLSRSCVCAESPELCTRLRRLARDAIAG